MFDPRVFQNPGDCNGDVVQVIAGLCIDFDERQAEQFGKQVGQHRLTCRGWTDQSKRMIAALTVMATEHLEGDTAQTTHGVLITDEAMERIVWILGIGPLCPHFLARRRIIGPEEPEFWLEDFGELGHRRSLSNKLMMVQPARKPMMPVRGRTSFLRTLRPSASCRRTASRMRSCSTA